MAVQLNEFGKPHDHLGPPQLKRAPFSVPEPPLEVDPITYATSRKGLFAGGDAQTGPWVAIGAIAAGKEAAESIVRYLDGRDMAKDREPVTKEDPQYRPIPDDLKKEKRAKMPELRVE